MSADERTRRYQRAVQDGGFLLGWHGSPNSVLPIMAVADAEQAELRAEVSLWKGERCLRGHAGCPCADPRPKDPS